MVPDSNSEILPNFSQHLHDLPVSKGQSAPSLDRRCQVSRPLENLPELSGYVASTLVLFTFVAKDMAVLRTVAIVSNLAFITYGTIEWLPPVLFLHLVLLPLMVLLPLNIVRLAEIVRATHATGDLTQADGAVRAQTLGADMIARGHSPIAPWSIFRIPKTAYPA